MESTEHQKIWWKIIYELTFLLLGVQAAQYVITPRPGEKTRRSIGPKPHRCRDGDENSSKMEGKILISRYSR